MNLKRITILSSFALLPALLAAQSDAPINYVRESARFTATGVFGSDNPPDVFATDSSSSPIALSRADFLNQFQLAWREGRGGVIDFDNPVYSEPYRDFDRSAVKRFIEAELRAASEAGEKFDFQPDRQAFIADARQRAAEAGLVDFSQRVPIINRNDPSLDDPSIRPQNELINFERIVAVYGNRKERELIIRRGPKFYVEGASATFDDEASESLNHLINDTYFFGVGRSTYANPIPISLPSSLNSGMTDLVFDARDNIVAMAFTMLSSNNFQYWQGLSAEPDRPNNQRVVVEFSDGSSQLITETTRQSSGGHDIFYAIAAPAGTSITRLWVRVVGRNFRTFTFLDDLAFITEPSVPYVASALAASGAQGQPLYYRLLTGQNPDTVSVSGLPAGLSFDSATGLISGVPGAAGEYPVTVNLSNAVGNQTETIVLNILAAEAAGRRPVITNAENLAANVTVAGELAPVAVVTDLDESDQPGDLSYFTIVYRLAEDGSRSLTSLDATGLGLAAGQLSGRPTNPTQVGNYLVEVFVTNDYGGDRAELRLSIFPVVPVPNFDGDGATDILWRDTASNRLYLLPSSQSFLDSVSKEFGVSGVVSPIDTGLSGRADTFVGFGDMDANNQADLIVAAANATQVDLRYYLEGMDSRTRSIGDLVAGWQVVMVGDLRGDGYPSVLLHNPVSQQYAVWHLVNDDLAWAGLLFDDGVQRQLVMDADFSGNGVRDLLFRRGPAHYELVAINILNAAGRIDFSSIEFTLPSDNWRPHMATDLDSNGTDDLIWKNTYSGQVMAWPMTGAEVPGDFLPELDKGAEPPPGPLSAQPGIELLPFGSPYEIVIALDVNEDRSRDLILLHRVDRIFFLQLMENLAPRGSPKQLTTAGSTIEVLAAGYYNADKQEDLLVRSTVTGEVSFWLMNAEGILATESLGTFPATAQFVSARRISMDTTLPAGRNDPVVPWLDATPLGDRWFDLPWFGVFFDPAIGWIYHSDHGYLVPAGEPGSLWLYDQKLNWLWTSENTYPWLFHADTGSWLWYLRGTKQPRWFFDLFLYFDWITEDDI